MMLNSGTGWFWNYDATKNFAADGLNPGKYLFSNGSAGRVGKAADSQQAQVKRSNVNWSAKFRPDGLLLTLLTPETKARYVVAPGAGCGGVGIESSGPATHFAIYGGKAPNAPATVLNTLLHTLSLREQARVTIYAMEVPAK